MNKWTERWFERAKQLSTWSKDPSTKIGAVYVDPVYNKELSSGYNGFPRLIEDTKERLNNREEKYKYVIHAEMNGIYNASLHGVCLDGSIVYIYGLPPCHECMKGMAQVGVIQIYCMYPKGADERWKDSARLAEAIAKEAMVKLYKFEI